ncbi:MAG TPA: DUF924 family protein, partial [Candidatus Binataceae bacterium]|nr:DUF924 family protein [Candidatus Binataceae bacterium]
GSSAETQRRWFSADAGFDNLCRARFFDTYEEAVAGQLEEWKGSPPTCLALILLLDQFPRNMFRDSPRAFASDSAAREIAEYGLAQGFDHQLPASKAIFFYLPLEHSEDLANQDECLRLTRALASAHPEVSGFLPYAESHRETIARFGRFPHRNRVLGRTSTLEEIEFLRESAG